MRIILFCLLAIPTAHAQQAPAAKKVRTSPWFNVQTLNFASLVPPPPTAGSEGDREDILAVLDAQRHRTPAEVAQAQADDKEEDIFIFASVFGPRFRASALPHAAALSQHLREASAVVNPALKVGFGRPRPFVASVEVHPVCEKTASNSFPSGHSMVGTLEALAAAQIVPERSEEIYQRLDEYLHNRIVCGVHYPSDVAASRMLASTLFGLVAASPAFQQELSLAKGEVRNALGLTTRVGGSAEADGDSAFPLSPNELVSGPTQAFGK